MTRMMTISTVTGLLGIILAMMSALTGAAHALLALGFVMMALGLLGALVGAAASLGQVWQSAR